MAYRNPINNLLAPITKVVSCKRCGCENLAWAQFASGSWALCDVQYERETAAGNIRRGPWANKMRAHNCEEYRTRLAQTLDSAQKQEAVTILSHAIMHLWASYGFAICSDASHPATQAAVILAQKASEL